MGVPVSLPPSRSLVVTCLKSCFFTLWSTIFSIPADESIAKTGISGNNFLTSVVTVPIPQASSKTLEEESGGKV